MRPSPKGRGGADERGLPLNLGPSPQRKLSKTLKMAFSATEKSAQEGKDVVGQKERGLRRGRRLYLQPSRSLTSMVQNEENLILKLTL